MNWKTILIIGLGILSITVLYYCYKRYYNEEGFQVTQNNTISTDTFVGSSAATRQYRFDGSILTLRQMYTEIINFLTDYKNFSGYANANLYNYYSVKYKKILTIVDFPYDRGNTVDTQTRYWFPYTGQYGASSNWLINFSGETTAVLDLDIYNNNLSNYISFINTYSAKNKQKFIFNRPLTRPSLLYHEINLTEPPSNYNILSSDGTGTTILDKNITQVAEFSDSRQSWYRNFVGTNDGNGNPRNDGYARIGKNLWPPSDDSRDTLYRVVYNKDKPPTLTYSQVNQERKAGQIVNLIPDRRRDLEYAISEQLELNVYGGELTTDHINSFRECMFLGSVFTNFDDQYNLDTILRVPYDGIINGSNCYYSFNMFLPELTPDVVMSGTTPTFRYIVNTENLSYNNNLISLRNNNTIKVLSDDDLKVDSNTFKTNVNSGFTSKAFTTITNSNDAYVGNIRDEMMAKIPNLARRYITSWVYNRSTRYLRMHLGDVTASSGINPNELKKAQYICLAMRNNFPERFINMFLSNYANYGSFTTGSGAFTTNGTISNVPNEEAAKRIVASSRIYNSYQYNPTTSNLSLSILKTGGKVFSDNNGSTSNFFRNADPSNSITGDILSSLLQLNDSISQVLSSFPTDGIRNALTNVNSGTVSPVVTAIQKAVSSTQYVATIMRNIVSSLGSLNNYLTNGNSYDQAVSLIDSLVNIVGNKIGDDITLSDITKNIQSITDKSKIKIEIDSNSFYLGGDTTNPGIFFVGNYIRIEGSANNNGDFYKIKAIDLSEEESKIIITLNTESLENKSSPEGTIRLSNLYIYLLEAKQNIDESNNLITSPTDENMIEAKKNIETNKVFVDSFISNFRAIQNTIKSISRGINIINNISKLFPVGTDWVSTITYKINNYVKLNGNRYKCIVENIDKNPSVGTNSNFWLRISQTDTTIKSDISGAIEIFTETIEYSETFKTNITDIQTNSTSGDVITYNDLVRIKNQQTFGTIDYRIAEENIDKYLKTLSQYNQAKTLLTNATTNKTNLENLKTTLTNLETIIGGGSIAEAMAAPTNLEIKTLESDFNNLSYNNKLIPNYGALSNLNISDESFLNSIAQLYYESSDGLYEMTTIYDVYMIGSNMIDIRFDKKQRLPNGRINNLQIQYMPQIQEYNRLIDIMEDGSWSQYYKDKQYTTAIPGQILTSNAIDLYYIDLSAATHKLDPIFNPIYPIDQNINVKDLQIQLSNLNTSNDIITKILNGKLTGSKAPYIAETQDTVGMNYTDRLATIQDSLYSQMYTIETQISGILQGCARVFVRPTLNNSKWSFPISGMAIGVNAALTYNLAYNGNLEIDMGNTQGNIGQYYPTIVYTKNITPPIICGDIKFINKAAALFNQTAFLNLSSMTTQITGDDLTKRGTSEASDLYQANVTARANNFYNSNDGPLYVNKILGFQQVNSNTCYYKWQETQYDSLTNNVFSTTDGIIKQRTVNVQYQFIYDNTEYQNPRLLPDNNPKSVRPGQGFKYLDTNTYVPFGDLYQSLYTWYASATRDLFSYLNNISNEYTRLWTPEYTNLMGLYNSNTSNISTLNVSTTILFSTNLAIANTFRQMLPTLTVTSIGGSCDSVLNKPPTFTSNYQSVIYNFRPGDGYGLTTHSGITYNKYRTIDIGVFMSNILNQTYTPSPDICTTIENPENCFTLEEDKCRYNLGTNSAQYRDIIMSNLNIRTSLLGAIAATNTAITTATTQINTAVNTVTRNYLTNNIIYSAGQTIEELYPQVSNINNKITALIRQSNATRKSIEDIGNQYIDINSKQQSDINLPTYMNNQVIPIIKPLPEEALSLDNQYGQCPSYLCTSPFVMNTLIEQYNLDNYYDDTITRVLKGATPNSYQCDYLVEVRKKNAIIIDSSLQFNRIRITPLQVSYNDNRDGMYFNGSNSYITVESTSEACFNLRSNNFTIDWFQHGIFDSDNETSIVFVVGNYSLGVTFQQRINNILRFNLYVNNSIKYIDFNYNQFNRWTYLAIVRYNNVITCYKDGFAFLSFEQQGDITGDITKIYIGNDRFRQERKYFKGCMRNFSFNNYDALYESNIFNTVPTNPIKNINTKFILQGRNDGNIINVINRIISQSNVNYNALAPDQITSQTFLTNGTILTEIFRGNNKNNTISVSQSGSIYIADTANHVIRKKNVDGTFSIIAGTLGVRGNQGIDNQGTLAYLNSPTGLYALNDVLFIADTGNNRICYISDNDSNLRLLKNVPNVKYISFDAITIGGSQTNYIYYVEGNGIYRIGFPIAGNREMIVNGLNNPSSIFIDNNHNLYVADTGNHRICKIVGSTLTTIVGTGLATTTTANLGDGGIASAATLKNPTGITVDSSGNLYIADNGNNRVRMVTFTDNKITTIAGNGTQSSSYNQGYAKFIPIIPESLLYRDNTLYFVDSRRICSIVKGDIPGKPIGYIYSFTPDDTLKYISVGNLGENDYKFNKNIFTIQWFMYMYDYNSGTQTIFTFENGNTIQLGVTFQGPTMNLWINGTSYTIEFIGNEIQSLWVHLGIVNNGSTLSLYKNGIQIYSIDSTNISFNTVDTQLTIGNRNTKDISKNFNGFMRDFIIYNKLAINYNNSILPYNSFFACVPNRVLYIANGSLTYNDMSLDNPDIVPNYVSYIDLFPYTNTYNPFKIKLNYNNNTQQEILFTTVNAYGTPLSVNIGTLQNITSFNIYSLQDTKAIQQWLLEGSSDGTNWITLHQQVEPYRNRSFPIYPKTNSYSPTIPIQVQRNIGGDYVTMTKSFKVATLIADCSIAITSNLDNQGNYTKGVTSSNGFFIQENTSYVADSSGSDVSGFQYIGNLLTDYGSNIKSVYDPIISDANTVSGTMRSNYEQTLSDTYSAVGKLNTLNFYSTQFNNYDTLRTYILNNVRFRNSIFDSYPDTNAYMSNIIRFNIADSNNIDIVFNKVNLTGNPTTNTITYGTTTTAAARYRLSVTQGFLDLTASFVSNVAPTKNILNDDYTTLLNTRGKDYKDRFNQTSKLVSGIRTPIPDTSITQSILPTVLTTIESLTGLIGITSSNIVDATKNKIEYMITTTDNLPIGKTNYIVQYVSLTEVNSIESATVDNTKFKIPIDVTNINTYITKFKEHFTPLYSKTKGYPFNSILKKVYAYNIVSNVLYLSVGIEYTKSDDSIYYNMMPNISEFGTQLYYKVIFKTDNNVFAFEAFTPRFSSTGEPLIPSGETFTNYTDTTALIQTGSTPSQIKNNYKNNLLWKQIKFIPKISSDNFRLTYSISQIQFFNSALLEQKKPIVIQSLSINGGTDFNLIKLIDGINVNLRLIENIRNNYFTHTYVGGEITATFKEPTSANGFSFMTAYSLQNPQKWVVQGTTDGTTWIDLVRQDTNYVDDVNVGFSIYNSFYRTPIFSFSEAQNVSLDQSIIRSSDTLETNSYLYLRIRSPISESFYYQLTQINLYNGQNAVPVSLTDNTLSYLFNSVNIRQTDPRNVQTYEALTNNPLLIQFTSPISFNGISFVTGIDVKKCMIKWIIEASDGTTNSSGELVYNTIHNQVFPYTNESIHYPHFFCRTPIFYSDSQIVETSQPPLYQTKIWPIRYVRFKPIYMYGAGRGETFEVSHIDFFNDATRLSASSSTNNNLLTLVTSSTRINQLNTFVGNYFDPSTNHIDFDFGVDSPQYFNGFSFMSGPQVNNCVQLWSLEVSIDNSFWVIAHSTKNIPFSNNYYPSPYYRLPIIFFYKNINITSDVKFYIVSGNPTSSTNNGKLYEINILYKQNVDRSYIEFITTDNNSSYSGWIVKDSSSSSFINNINWSLFNQANFFPETIYYNKIYPSNTDNPQIQNTTLYALKNPFNIHDSSKKFFAILSVTPGTYDDEGTLISYSENPVVYGNYPGVDIYNNIISDTFFTIYTNIQSRSGVLFDTNGTYHLDQISQQPITSSQGFTNYTKIDYIETFLLQTNKSFDIKLFRFITSNNKFLSKMFYSVESQNKNFIIRLKAYVEIIGYTIRTGLYSKVSDPDSWKLFGMKNGSYILLDKQENYDIPVERSRTLPPFYFGSKEKIPSIQNEEDTKENKPNMDIIEVYYKQKINPFGKAVFKQYMYDNNKTYYMIFDEYDNNRNLIGEDLIIGFVIVKEKVKKPIMYENPDGSFDAFNLKKKEMMAFWKKKILINGLKLETKYLSDY